MRIRGIVAICHVLGRKDYYNHCTLDGSDPDGYYVVFGIYHFIGKTYRLINRPLYWQYK
jgi:hypothetical protein